VTKAHLFEGGVETILERRPQDRALVIEAYAEGAARMVAQLRLSAPEADEVVLSGRMAREDDVVRRLTALIGDELTSRTLGGFASIAKQGAQGAAIIADGLAGGAHAELVERLRLREATGTVLDHLFVIDPAEARRKLGMENGG
jgi:predicted butyrate kinase (DUF1464 family)